METDKMYRVIRFCGIGMIFLSLSWAVFKSSTPSQQRPSFAKAVGLYTDGKFEEALKFYNTAVLENPNFIHAKRGRARTLMQLGKDQQALDSVSCRRGDPRIGLVFDAEAAVAGQDGGTAALEAAAEDVFDNSGFHQGAVHK